MATPSLSLAHRMGEGGRRPGEGKLAAISSRMKAAVNAPALQTLRELRRRPAVAKRLEWACLSHRFRMGRGIQRKVAKTPRRRIPDERLSAVPDDEKTSRPLVMTKAMEWSYEKEWRVVMMSVEDQQNHFEDWQFSPRSLSKILLGCRISPRNREAIKRLTTGDFAHVEIHEAFKTSARFGLGFKRIR